MNSPYDRQESPQEEINKCAYLELRGRPSIQGTPVPKKTQVISWIVSNPENKPSILVYIQKIYIDVKKT